jgi:hypothetical protein
MIRRYLMLGKVIGNANFFLYPEVVRLWRTAKCISPGFTRGAALKQA